MCPRELWYVRQCYPVYIRFVEPYSKVSLSTEQKEDEHTNMEHTYQGCSQQTKREKEEMDLKMAL